MKKYGISESSPYYDFIVNYVVIIVGLLSLIGDAIFLILSLCIKRLVPHEVYCISWSCLLSFYAILIIVLIINKIFILLVNN